MSSRVYEAFYLVTVPQGRQGVIPYQYPSAASNPELSARLPKVKVSKQTLLPPLLCPHTCSFCDLCYGRITGYDWVLLPGPG
jgi:hypothetical protein